MKRICILLINAMFFSIVTYSQEAGSKSRRTTVYPQFIPATITLESGKTVKERFANVFMKNGTLLYKRNGFNMQADMGRIKRVDFADRTYLKVDTMLAYVVDTVGNNKLLCSTVIDLNSYKTELLNNRQITNLELGSHVNISTMDLSDTNEYPLINLYYYDIAGKIIKVHERNVMRAIPKNKRREFTNIIQSDGFSWTDKEWLMRLLEMIR